MQNTRTNFPTPLGHFAILYEFQLAILRLLGAQGIRGKVQVLPKRASRNAAFVPLALSAGKTMELLHSNAVVSPR